MLQMLLSILIPIIAQVLKLVLQNPKVAAEEASVIHDIAVDATQADMATNPSYTWTLTQGGASATQASAAKAAK
jgi:hypothetical protein